MSEPVVVGDVIADKYRVDRVIGRGGMGMVVAATHLELLSVRAIKLMLPEANGVPMAIERFLREARAASELTSEHVAHVFDVGRLADGTPFIVMEHLEGRDLAAELAQRVALPVEEAVLYAIQVCEALAEAHARGIVHRDLKPGNLFLTAANDGSPRIKVLDFGISKLLDPHKATIHGKRTTSGAVLGSPLYMSPEQIRGDRDLDGRCDIWGLGVILYQIITGGLPFDCGSVLQSIAMALENPAPPPSQRAPGLPPALDAVILRCLEKRSVDRYPDMAALARDLLPFAPPSAAPLVERVGRVAASRARGVPPSSSDAIASTIASPAARTLASAAPRTIVPSAAAASVVIRPAPPPESPGAPAPGVGTGSGVVSEHPVKTTTVPPESRRFTSRVIAAAIALVALGSGTLALAVRHRPQPAALRAIAAGPAAAKASLSPAEPPAETVTSASIAASAAPPTSETAAPSSSQKTPRAPLKRWSSAPPRY